MWLKKVTKKKNKKIQWCKRKRSQVTSACIDTGLNIADRKQYLQRDVCSTAGWRNDISELSRWLWNVSAGLKPFHRATDGRTGTISVCAVACFSWPPVFKNTQFTQSCYDVSASTEHTACRCFPFRNLRVSKPHPPPLMRGHMVAPLD